MTGWTHRLLGAAGLIVMCVAGGVAQTVSLTRVGSIAGPADMIEVDGRYAYVTSGKTLSIIDVSDPTAPTRAGTYTFPELIWGVTVAGSRVYVAADTYGLGILDVSRPAAPTLVGSLKTPGQAKSVALLDRRLALVADHVAGIDLVDISMPAPRLESSFFVDGFAKDVVTRGQLVYALDQPDGFTILDLSRPGALTPTGSLTLVSPIPLRAQLDVSESSSPRLAVVVGGGPVQIYDVSDARKPVHAATYRMPGAAQRVALQGSRLLVANGPAGLQVVDLTKPSTPTIVGTYKTAAPARDVAVAGSLVFVVSGSDEVVILRQQP